jgi:hypothetical protein
MNVKHHYKKNNMSKDRLNQIETGAFSILSFLGILFSLFYDINKHKSFHSIHCEAIIRNI